MGVETGSGRVQRISTTKGNIEGYDVVGIADDKAAASINDIIAGMLLGVVSPLPSMLSMLNFQKTCIMNASTSPVYT